MACFLVPAAEALVTTVIKKAAKSKESTACTTEDCIQENKETRIPFSRKLGWLTNLLCGGSALLAFEHLWHGEVTPWFPFLTAAGNTADTAEMLHEMSTVGVSMAALITFVWGGMLVVSGIMERKAEKVQPESK